MTRVMGLFLFAIAACSSKSSQPSVDPKAAQAFVRALESIGADPRPAAKLAQAAYQTIAPSMKCFESFAAAADGRKRAEALFDCGLACTPDAVQTLKGKEPRTWMATLTGACEPGHYGLEKSNAAMLSPEWFLLFKIRQIAAPHVEAATGDDKVALDKALAAFRMPLPLPAMANGLYELPPAPAEASEPVAALTYVIVPIQGPLRVGATPVGTLDASSAAMEAPGGQVQFPGNESSAAEVATAVRMAAGSAREEAIPLLLADARRPYSEVAEVIAALPAVRIGVGAPDDPAARALTLEVRAVPRGAASEEGWSQVSLERTAPWSDATAKAAEARKGGATRVAFVVASAGADDDSDFSVMHDVLQANIRTLSICHERLLKVNPSLDGRVSLRFTVAPDGSVKDASATGFDEIDDCVVKQLKTIKFPKPSDPENATVEYPLVFKANR